MLIFRSVDPFFNWEWGQNAQLEQKNIPNKNNDNIKERRAGQEKDNNNSSNNSRNIIPFGKTIFHTTVTSLETSSHWKSEG